MKIHNYFKMIVYGIILKSKELHFIFNNSNIFRNEYLKVSNFAQLFKNPEL